MNEIPHIIHYCWFGGNPLPEDYKKYISLFHLNEEEKKIVESLILKVKWIIKLKDETPQKSTRLYLKPIMFQKDYKNIDKVLNDQLSLKVDRNCERYKRQLEENKILKYLGKIK